jgi:hypothetical protein
MVLANRVALPDHEYCPSGIIRLARMTTRQTLDLEWLSGYV